MRYLLLICDDEKAVNGLPESELDRRHEGWLTFTQELVSAERMRGGERLRPAASATTLRVRDGQRLLSDGPFAETKEQLGGYYVIDAADLDDAVDWASKMPHLTGGGAVEIRPIWEI